MKFFDRLFGRKTLKCIDDSSLESSEKEDAHLDEQIKTAFQAHKTATDELVQASQKYGRDAEFLRQVIGDVLDRAKNSRSKHRAIPK